MKVALGGIKITYASPSTINASRGLGEIINYTNSVTNQWFSNMILIAIYVIVLIGFYKAKEDFTGALAVAGFGTFVVALLFWIGGMVSGIALGITIAMAIIGVIVLLMDQQG
jgi:hypothetical protein